MAKVGGSRNFGYGKQMAWAGTQAIAERYGEGHFGTVPAHAERWGQFAAWAKANGVRDARAITREMVVGYGQAVSEEVRQGTLTVSYAQNLLSTVSVALEAMRADRRVRVSPSALIGQRERVRDTVPRGLDRGAVARCADALRAAGQERVASVVELARDLGLRVREASMLDARAALREAANHGAVNVTAGTKGGRGHRVDRWVPVSARALATIERAAAEQGRCRNLIPEALSWRQWNDRLHRAWAAGRGQHGLGKLHDLRSAYACERYRELTGSPAPVVAGGRAVPRDTDRAAREIIAEELGHSRIDVVVAYIGSAK